MKESDKITPFYDFYDRYYQNEMMRIFLVFKVKISKDFFLLVETDLRNLYRYYFVHKDT